jgi:hypothetical protein
MLGRRLTTPEAPLRSEIWFALPGCASFLTGMSTVQEIRTAIERLPVEERATLVAELCGWVDDDWDRRLKADAAAGKFGALNEGAANSYGSGQAKPLDEILGQ